MTYENKEAHNFQSMPIPGFKLNMATLNRLTAESKEIDYFLPIFWDCWVEGTNNYGKWSQRRT